MDILTYVLFLVIGFAIGVLVCSLSFLKKQSDSKHKLAESEFKFSQTTESLENSKNKITSLEHQVDSLQEHKINSVSHISKLESQLESAKENMLDKVDQIEQKNSQLRVHSENEIRQQKRISELEVELQKTFEGMEEKLKLLESAKLELSNNFKVLANDIFEEKSKRFVDINQSKLDDVLKPFKTNLDEFKHKVDRVYSEESQQRASLKGELGKLFELNQKMNVEAQNLTRALKGNKQKQGAWGELILERVLETSGLRNGIEYETQVTVKDESDKIFRPDVVVHMPDKRDVIIDSKVSLNAYEAYTNEDDEDLKGTYLKAHIQAVKQHIESLSNKQYENLKNVNSLDFILMFMPIESAFVVAFQHDEDLFRKAFNKKIVVVTPTTLLATLGTIKNTWNYQHQNANAQKIAEDAGKMLDK
ncbi:DNA recombination protein RmuC, partial [Francisellaceae bacterium]|nr:DNA recombination protein RmuC [Francisellaceae bacterium]